MTPPQNQPTREELDDFMKMMRRAERNGRLFNSISWQAHLEILENDELPKLEKALDLIEQNMEHFANDPDELERLEDCRQVAMRSIAHLRTRKPESGGAK